MCYNSLREETNGSDETGAGIRRDNEQCCKMQFVLIRRKLEEDGRLVSPYGEKVEGRDDLFAIRIRHGQNVMFFYCYAVGDIVWVLSGFEKKTEKTPPVEIRKALKIKKELGL